MTNPSASLAYNRLTFGPMCRDATAPTSATVSQWLATQIHAPAGDAPNVQAALASVLLAFNDRDANGQPIPTQYLTLTTLGQNQTALWLAYKATGKDFAKQVRPAQEVQAASYIRAAQSPNQVWQGASVRRLPNCFLTLRATCDRLTLIGVNH